VSLGQPPSRVQRCARGEQTGNSSDSARPCVPDGLRHAEPDGREHRDHGQNQQDGTGERQHQAQPEPANRLTRNAAFGLGQFRHADNEFSQRFQRRSLAGVIDRSVPGTEQSPDQQAHAESQTHGGEGMVLDLLLGHIVRILGVLFG